MVSSWNLDYVTGYIQNFLWEFKYCSVLRRGGGGLCGGLRTPMRAFPIMWTTRQNTHCTVTTAKQPRLPLFKDPNSFFGFPWTAHTKSRIWPCSFSFIPRLICYSFFHLSFLNRGQKFTSVNFGKTYSGIADWSLLRYTRKVINKVLKNKYCLLEGYEIQLKIFQDFLKVKVKLNNTIC